MSNKPLEILKTEIWGYLLLRHTHPYSDRYLHSIFPSFNIFFSTEQVLETL